MKYYENLRLGLKAPICLTWELTHACNLSCAHCASSSGKRNSNELSTAEAKGLIDEWAEMKVFYINVGGGEPMLHPDFVELMNYALDQGIGVNFSTNGTLMDSSVVDWIASNPLLDVQISLDGASANTNSLLRGDDSYSYAHHAMRQLAQGGVSFKISTVVTRWNISELDDLYAIASDHGAQLRVTRLRPTGRGQHIWREYRPTFSQNQTLCQWLIKHPDVKTGDSFFHLSAYGEPLEGLNMCGAGRIVCCVNPVGEVFPCAFMNASEFSAGNVRQPGGFIQIWQASSIFAQLRSQEVDGECRVCIAYSLCHGGCIAVKYFTGHSFDDIDPDCVFNKI